MIERTMGKDNFYEILIAPLSRNGVGLPNTRAKFLADKVFKMLKHSEDVRRYRRRMNEGTFFSREDKLINELLFYVSEEAEIKINREQKAILKQAVRDRVSGLIRKEELEDLLKKSKEAKDKVETQIDHTVKDTLNKMKLVTRKDYEALEERLRQVEQELTKKKTN